MAVAGDPLTPMIPTPSESHVHETWLGLAQPFEGLTLSVPVLVDGQCDQAFAAADRHEFSDWVDTLRDADDAAFVDALVRGMHELLGYHGGALHRVGDERHDVWVSEGHQTLRPTAWVGDDETAHALIWALPAVDDLDAPEDLTGPWRYPPTAKMTRLLRGNGVAMGWLVTRHEWRLVYAPSGETAGWLSFRFDAMRTAAGQPLHDAWRSLFECYRQIGIDEGRTLLAMLRDSRTRQADVTTALARQVFGAIETLLQGFVAAGARAEASGGRDVLAEALRDDPDAVYSGLLTTLLRLVFLLYAEDRQLMPVDHPLYRDHYSVRGLAAQLRDDHARHPDTMHARFGAWPRLLALFRAVHDGARLPVLEGGAITGWVDVPARHGHLFDPDRFAFLEGRSPGEPTARLPDERAEATPPRIDDATVLAVLDALTILDREHLSYASLGVAEIGSVYERLMGYHILRADSPGACLKPNHVWVTVDELRAVAPRQRGKWLKTEAGLSKARADKLADAFADALATAGDDADAAAANAAAVLLTEAATQRTDAGRVPRRCAAGDLIVQPGEERRRTSSHYTPPSLSRPIVARTLEPVVAAIARRNAIVAGELAADADASAFDVDPASWSDAIAPRAEQLLALKVCDPAMGSGAFLVEACGWLADRVVEAWARDGSLAARQAEGDPVLAARRLVAQRCLYGVDRNRFAVDLARLSMWLYTLARDLPFTFVNHALRYGDSLVGLDRRQLEDANWERTDQLGLWSKELRAAFDEALTLRRRIVGLAEATDEASVNEREWLLTNADEALQRATLVGDIVVSAFFAESKKKARSTTLVQRMAQVEQWLGDGGAWPPPAQLLVWQQEVHAQTPVFHWPLAFPEVFVAEREDLLAPGEANAMFDAFVGNPPFLGGTMISTNNSDAYRDWCFLPDRIGGTCDLAAMFLRRSRDQLGDHGTLGMIVTNTISQGDTREGGLQHLVASLAAVVYDAENDRPWPGQAAVTISTVHLAFGATRAVTGNVILDGKECTAINSRLMPGLERPDPVKLSRNAGKSFIGTKVYGQGFTLTPEERDAYIASDPRNAERIFAYLGGQEVNSSPTQSHHRYVISFGELELADAERWPELMQRVREQVKPERDKNKRAIRRKYWWRFGETTPALYEAIAPLNRCLVTARVSKHLMFSFQPTDRILNEKLYVFPFDDHAHFALLQSRVHAPWTWLLSSTLKTDLNYSASDCFETFPFPPDAAFAADGAMERTGKALYEARAAHLVEHNIGLTTLYNALTDPDDTDPAIAALRRLHEAMDRAVLDAYGWGDIDVPPYETPADDVARKRFEAEVIDRLFAENARQAARDAR